MAPKKRNTDGHMKIIDFGKTPDGKWWWVHRGENVRQGPFATEEEAERDAAAAMGIPATAPFEDGEVPAWVLAGDETEH